MSLIFTGAKAVVKYEGFPLVFVSSMSVDQEHRLGEIPQLDKLEVAEYSEDGHRCRFTINKFKIPEVNDAAQLGLDPLDIKDILVLPEAIVEIFNDDTDVPVYVIEGAKFEGGSGSVDARGVWTGVWRFKARRGRGL